MKRIIVFLILLSTVFAPQCVGRKGSAQADSNRILPSSGKAVTSIGVFGGSLSVKPESNVGKQYWADALKAEVTSYGVGGAGFAISRGHSLQKQVDSAGVHDIYILWASTNDFVGEEECGSWKDYTELDGFDTSRLDTQCGGINYCVRKLREKNPQARILFFTSLRFFRRESGYNPFSTDANSTGKTFADYVKAQIECCRYHGIPVLDQFSEQDVDIHNFQDFFLPDSLHMSEAGYLRIAPVQASFIAGHN